MAFESLRNDVAAAQTWSKSVGAAIVLVAVLTAVVSYTAFGGRRDDLQIVTYCVAALLAAVGFGTVASGFSPVDAHPVLVQLKRDPDAILWVTTVAIVKNGVHTNTLLTLHLRSGAPIQTELRKAVAARWVAELARELPRLIVGDGPDQRARYQAIRAATSRA